MKENTDTDIPKVRSLYSKTAKLGAPVLGGNIKMEIIIRTYAKGHRERHVVITPISQQTNVELQSREFNDGDVAWMEIYFRELNAKDHIDRCMGWIKTKLAKKVV